MFRTALMFSLLVGWQIPGLAQTEEIPGMPSDPAAAEPQPPPRIEDAPAPPQEPAAQEEDTAAAEDGDDGVPRPPVLPEQMESGEPIEPEVTIIKRDGATIEEYRVNGKMYMVKITPSAGKPYYLVDRDGDGQMESRLSEVYDDFVVPQWVIFSW